MRLSRHLTAIGFAIGTAAHAIGLLLLGIGVELYGPGYSAWRHAVFAVSDAAIAWMAVKRSRWLVFALVAFLVDQLVEHGLGPVSVLVMIAAIAAGLEWRRSKTSEPELLSRPSSRSTP